MGAYKRTIYFVNPRFQIKFSLFVSSLVFFCSLIYPIIIYEGYDHLIEKTSNTELLERLMSAKSDILQLLILLQIIFFILVFIICIFQGHKIAGPLYRLKEHLNGIKAGEIQEKISFRKGDNFQELAKDYNSAMEAVNRIMAEKDQRFEELNRYLANRLANASEEEKEIYREILHKISSFQKENRSK